MKYDKTITSGAKDLYLVHFGKGAEVIYQLALARPNDVCGNASDEQKADDYQKSVTFQHRT